MKVKTYLVIAALLAALVVPLLIGSVASAQANGEWYRACFTEHGCLLHDGSAGETMFVPYKWGYSATEMYTHNIHDVYGNWMWVWVEAIGY